MGKPQKWKINDDFQLFQYFTDAIQKSILHPLSLYIIVFNKATDTLANLCEGRTLYNALVVPVKYNYSSEAK